MPGKRKTTAEKNALLEKRVRNLERSLREERQALLAVTTAFLKEANDPAALVARLEGMCRAAQANRKVKPHVREALLHALNLVKSATAIHMEKPQPLFNPDVGHTDPTKVKELVSGGEQPQQTGMAFQDDGQAALGDVEEAHQEQEQFHEQVRTHVLDLYREHGAMTDDALMLRHMRSGNPVHASYEIVKKERRHLSSIGRLTKVDAQDGNPLYDLTERSL